MLRLLALLLFAFATPSVAAPPAELALFRIIGYVADGEVLPAITPAKLDIINFAFAKVGEDHRVYLPTPTAAQRLKELGELRRDNPRLKIVLSVGGWGAGHFSEAAATAQARAIFVDSAVALVQAHGLDGFDVDWEYPTLPGPGISHSPADRDNFSLLLEELRTRLDAQGHELDRDYLLTIAAADGEAARGLDIPRIARVLDAINLMTYDFHGSLTPTTGHHASLFRSASAAPGSRNAEQAVDEFLRAGVPARKLFLGVAFYGRHFDEVEPDNDGLHQRYHQGGGFLTWREISRDYSKRDGYVRHWDEQAQAPWLWNAQRRHMISYDDPQSLRAKAAFARERGLGGIMYWEHGLDDDEQLLDAVAAGLRMR